jgi:phytoene dehydrogenase-like protein
MLGRECFDRGYLSYVVQLRPSWGGLGIRYYLSKEVLAHTLYYSFTDNNYSLRDFQEMAEGRFPDDLSVYIRVPSIADGSLAPQGKQAAIAMTFCPPDPRLDMTPWLKKFEETVARLWPEIPAYTERKDVFGPARIAAKSRWGTVLPGHGGEAIGVGQIAGQCGPDKPRVRAPLPGLFFVGADAGGEGIGLEMAACSGRKVAGEVEFYLHAKNFSIGKGRGVLR